MLAIIFTLSLSFLGLIIDNPKTNAPPEFLYKIVTIDDWVNSQPQGYLILPSDDSDFVHFSTKEQLPNIIQKYWYNRGNFYVLKVRPSWLEGRMVKEANPGGKTEYYHLYEGKIPLTAVIEAWLTSAAR